MMTTKVCKISPLNSKSILRKLSNILGGATFLPHAVRVRDVTESEQCAVYNASWTYTHRDTQRQRDRERERERVAAAAATEMHWLQWSIYWAENSTHSMRLIHTDRHEDRSHWRSYAPHCKCFRKVYSSQSQKAVVVFKFHWQVFHLVPEM